MGGSYTKAAEQNLALRAPYNFGGMSKIENVCATRGRAIDHFVLEFPKNIAFFLRVGLFLKEGRLGVELCKASWTGELSSR